MEVDSDAAKSIIPVTTNTTAPDMDAVVGYTELSEAYLARDNVGALGSRASVVNTELKLAEVDGNCYFLSTLWL